MTKRRVGIKARLQRVKFDLASLQHLPARPDLRAVAIDELHRIRKVPADMRAGFANYEYKNRIDLVSLEVGGWLLTNAVATDSLSLNTDPLNVLMLLEELIADEHGDEAQQFVLDLLNHTTR